MIVDVGRRADLLDATVVEDREPVAHREGLALVVRDVDERDADAALEALQFQLHLLAELEVERAERLVEQQHARTVDERTRERHALPLSAGKLRRLAVVQTREPHEFEHLAGTPPPLGLRDLADHQGVLDVLADAHVREQRVVLEDGRDVAGVRRRARDVVAVDLDAAAGRLLESGDQAQAGGLARTGRTEHGEELAVRDLERDLADGEHVAERPADRMERDRRRGRAGRGGTQGGPRDQRPPRIAM